MREVGEESTEPCVVLPEPAVDDDHPEVVLGGKQMLESLREEHESGGVGVLGGGEELGRLAEAQLDLQQRDVTGDRRPRERRDDGVGERRRDLARADPVPLDLAIRRPAMLGKRRLPELAEERPVGVAERDPAEREELLLRELSGLVEEEQVYRPRLLPLPRRPCQRLELGHLTLELGCEWARAASCEHVGE